MKEYAVCFFLFTLAALPAQTLKYRDFVASDAKQEDLHGNVQEVREKTFEETEGGKLQPVSESRSVFDPAGYKLESVETDLEERETTTTIWTYDAVGNLMQEQETKTGQSAVLRTIRLLPERKRIEKEIVAVGGRKQVVTEMNFDSFGKEGNGRDFDDKGSLQSIYQTKRDHLGRETTVIFSDANGMPENILNITWDARNFAVAEVSEHKKDKFTVKITREYPDIDSQGNWTKEISSIVFFEKGRKQGSSREVTTREIVYH